MSPNQCNLIPGLPLFQIKSCRRFDSIVAWALGDIGFIAGTLEKLGGFNNHLQKAASIETFFLTFKLIYFLYSFTSQVLFTPCFCPLVLSEVENLLRVLLNQQWTQIHCNYDDFLKEKFSIQMCPFQFFTSPINSSPMITSIVLVES